MDGRTYNDVVRDLTLEVLNKIDPDDPPEPSDLEYQIIRRVNDNLSLDNAGKDKYNRYALLKTLTPQQIALILTHLHGVCRLGLVGPNGDPDMDISALYMNSGDDKGLYATSDSAFRIIARQYNFSLDTRAFEQVKMAVMDGAPRKFRCMDPDLVAVNNGIFDYKNKTLRTFTPSLVFLTKSHVDYVPNPENPVIEMPDGEMWDVESWMSSLSDDPEVVDSLWEVMSAIIRPNVRWNKTAWFYSTEGNNGKGTVCELARQLCGPTSYASIPISDFGKDFLLEPLIRASAIIVDENDVGTFVDKAANMKAIITNDVIGINRKFKSPVAYRFYGFMIQCLNEFPRFKDKSESLYRRNLFIPFEKNFKGIERGYIKDDYLRRPEVLQYVLHKVLHSNFYKLSEPTKVLEVLDEFKMANDPLRLFWDEFAKDFQWDLLPFTFLYDLYSVWFPKNNPSGMPVGRNQFIEQIVAIANSEVPGRFRCESRKSVIRANARMAKTETLIGRYRLKAWMNPTYQGNNVERMSQPVLSAGYRGLVRVGTDEGPMGIVSDEPEESDSTITIAT